MQNTKNPSLRRQGVPEMSSRSNPPLAVVLGANEIASAIALFLRRFGRPVVLSHDPLAPVIRRRMAFHDALFEDVHWLENIAATRIDSVSELLEIVSHKDRVAVTMLGLTDLLVLGQLDIVVDARMHKRPIMPRLRGLARTTIGLGPGFAAGWNCDMAIETRPDIAGMVLRQGMTMPRAAAMPSMLGGIGSERFVYTQAPGRWRTALEIGARVFKGVIVGHQGGAPVAAPIDGILRGLARDGAEMPAGVKLIEVDPRGRAAKWAGVDERARVIAEATVRAIMLCEADRFSCQHPPSLLLN
jgi:xanthine dehydrogenase accessory factor